MGSDYVFFAIDRRSFIYSFDLEEVINHYELDQHCLARRMDDFLKNFHVATVTPESSNFS